MKTVVILVLVLVLANSNAIGQKPKNRSRAFPDYTVDTLHIKGSSETIKRTIIGLQDQDAVRSAFYDENDNVLTVEYDSSRLQLKIIRDYFIDNLTTRTIYIIARMKKTD